MFGVRRSQDKVASRSADKCAVGFVELTSYELAEFVNEIG